MGKEGTIFKSKLEKIRTTGFLFS